VLHIENLDFQHIAGLCAFDEHGTVERVNFAEVQAGQISRAPP
jgi:hypothetical protein